jgi:hypothetical protein
VPIAWYIEDNDPQKDREGVKSAGLPDRESALHHCRALRNQHRKDCIRKVYSDGGDEIRSVMADVASA